MESYGRKGRCLYTKKWEGDPQYKGWVSALKADTRKQCVNGMTRQLTFEVWARVHLNCNQKARDTSKTVKLKFQSGKAINSNLEKLISCTTMTVSFLYCMCLCRTSYTRSHLNSIQLRGLLHVCQIEWKTSPCKNANCPRKVLEKYLNRKVFGLYEPCFSVPGFLSGDFLK